MRSFLVISILVTLLPLASCGGARRSLNACTLVDPSLAESLTGDRTGEPSTISDNETHNYVGCYWTDRNKANSLNVEAKVYDNPKTAEADFYRTAQTWECHTTLATPKPSNACAYKSPLDTGVIITKGPVMARIGYKGPGTPQHDQNRHPVIAQQLATKATTTL
ncbi:hypothetical protein [Actinomadura rugatobispora]|uniref:DUF3558 domain-containing protein n=1 Tax=Actinomadura rugatobispora TaxID=1994 RepID=A0ABW1A2X3_9ACTN|nr:hypothetical protein GCM10010200_038610 [Actinomadura rugatobispora]